MTGIWIKIDELLRSVNGKHSIIFITTATTTTTTTGK